MHLVPRNRAFTGPADFFDEPDRVIDRPSTPGEFYDELTNGSFVERFVDLFRNGPSDPADFMLYRGQRDATWGIHSLLYRSLVDSGVSTVDEKQLDAAERVLLPAMREQGLGRLMTDGQLMSVMQHHGLPTRLIDVSEGVREALYFAVDKDDRTDGRLFFIQPPNAYSVTSFTFDAEVAESPEEQQAPWRAKRLQERRYVVEAVRDHSLDPRMQAQRGIFLTGGLPSKRYGGVALLKYAGGSLTAEEQTMVSNLYLVWPKRVTAGAPHAARRWAAYSFRIPSKWKPALRELLKPDGIEEKRMFPKYTETERLAVHLAARAGGAGRA